MREKVIVCREIFFASEQHLSAHETCSYHLGQFFLLNIKGIRVHPFYIIIVNLVL